MLDSLDARWLFFGTRIEHFDKSWTRVGLVLDSCWTRVGVCLAYYLHSFWCSSLSSCWTHVGLLLDSLDAGACLFVQKICDGGKQPVWNFKILKGQRSGSPGPVQLFRAASPTFPGRPRKPKGSRLRRNIVLGALLPNGVRPQ